MKPVFIILIVVAVIALVVGGVFLTIGLVNKNKDSIITREHEIDEATAVNNINIDLTTADLEFKVTEENKAKIILEEKAKEYHKITVFNNDLTIQAIDERKWHEKFIFLYNLKRMKVTVFLPEATYGNLVIDMATGNATLPAGLTFNNIALDVSTGDVEISSNANEMVEVEGSTGDIIINNVTAKRVDVDSSTGSVTLNKVAATDNIEIDCSTGKITLTDVTCKNLTTEVSTGNIKFIRTVVVEKITADASTGSIIFDRSDAATLDIEASTGSISGTLLTSKIFQATADTGKVNVPNTTTGGVCKLKTGIGSIDIQIIE